MVVCIHKLNAQEGSQVCRTSEACMLQASKAPSKDLSAREIAATERFSEHLLFLQRHQRAFLSGLGIANARLLALANLLSAFADADSIPDQVPHCRSFSFDPQQSHIACCSTGFKKPAAIRLGIEVSVLQLL